MRAVVVAVFFCWSAGLAFADVRCEPVVGEPDRWLCYGFGNDSPPVIHVISNFLGVCTNCVGMSPSTCASIKSALYAGLTSLNDNINGTMNFSVNPAIYTIQGFIYKWDDIHVNYYTSANVPPDMSLADWLYSQVQYDYILNQAGADGSTSSFVVQGSGLNSIANYYQQEVKPFADRLLQDLNNTKSYLGYIVQQARSLQSTVGQIDCAQCTATPDSPGMPYPDDPTGPGGGGSDSSCCDHGPMLEQMQGLLSALDRIDNKAQVISNSVDSLYREFKAYSKNVLGALSTISNSVFRLDSYVTQDLKKSVEQITNSLVIVERNVDGIQRDFYLAMSNAQHFVSMGDKEWNPVEISTNFFEVGEYKDLPWASRVEALLLSIAKPFSDDSSFDSPDTAEGEEDMRKAGESLGAAISDIGKSGQDSQTVISAARSAVESVSGVFTSPGGSAVPIKLLEPDQWIGDEGLNITISPEVLDTSHTIFLLLWSCLALVVYVKLFVFSVTLAIKVWNWLYKRYTILFT